MQFKLTIRNKIPTFASGVYFGVNDNTDYTILFDFDSEWNSFPTKTCRFRFGCDSNFTDVVFNGNTCSIPKFQDVSEVEVGVFAGNLHTTTPAILEFRESILHDGGEQIDPPSSSVYDQIMAIINGFSASVVKTGSTAVITIVDPHGTTTASVTDGKSAYEYAVEAGYTGTEEQFAELMNSMDAVIQVIPSTASANNKLTDKAYVDAQVATKSTVSVSSSGTSTTEAKYITVNGNEFKVAGSDSGAVKYDEAQTLTTSEQTQARDNIDAEKKITSSNKLSADLVDDTNSTNKFTTSAEKQTWNSKSTVSASSSQVAGATEAKSLNINGTNYNLGGGTITDVTQNGVSIVEDHIAKIVLETGLGTDSNNSATVTAIRAFVNASIEAVAANYITSNASGDAFATRAALIAGPWYYAGQLKTPTRNDYAVVIADETHSNQTARYTYTVAQGAQSGQWDFQYPFNMQFTQAQINALNSGITSAKVALYDAHLLNTSNPHSVTKAQVGLGNVDNKSEATIKTDFTGSIASGNTGFVTGGDAYTALQGKQATIDNAHKLSSDLVDDTNHSNKFVTETQRSTLANAITNDGIGTCTSETTTVSVWNGDYTGFTKYGYTSNYVVKMSNDPIAYESLLGKTLGYKFSEANTLTLSAENTFVDTTDPNVITAWDVEYGAPILYSVFADTTAIFDDITVPRGLYFVWMTHPDFENPPWYTTSLTGLSWTQTIEEVNQIANKFIPLSAGNGIKYYDGVISFNGNDIIDEGKFTVLGVQERIDTPYGTLVEAGEDQHYVDQNIQMGFSSGLGKSLKLKSLGKLTDFDGTPLVSGTNDGTNWSTITLDGVTKNIPNGTDSNAVHYTADTGKTDTQKQQARTNINAQKTIDSSNKLASDLVDDTNQTNKFVTSAEKTTWNNKQAQLVSGSNIKTINNQSILGAGNLNVSGLPSAQTAGSGAIYNGTNWVAQTGYAYITGNAGGSISWVGEHTNPEMIISQTTFFADPYYNINNTTIPTRTGVVGGSYKYHDYSESTDTTVTITSNMLQTIQAWVDSWEDPDATVTGATNDDFIIDGYIFVLHNTVTITIPTEGSGAHIMPAGVWVYSYDEGTEGETIQNLTWLSTEVVHQFDTRFIPTQADSNAVHYTADSNKSDAEKAQARSNINASPVIKIEILESGDT